jgi:hypothetical protein
VIKCHRWIPRRRRRIRSVALWAALSLAVPVAPVFSGAAYLQSFGGAGPTSVLPAERETFWTVRITAGALVLWWHIGRPLNRLARSALQTVEFRVAKGRLLVHVDGIFGSKTPHAWYADDIDDVYAIPRRGRRPGELRILPACARYAGVAAMQPDALVTHTTLEVRRGVLTRTRRTPFGEKTETWHCGDVVDVSTAHPPAVEMTLWTRALVDLVHAATPSDAEHLAAALRVALATPAPRSPSVTPEIAKEAIAT